jgi:AraC family transcriptional regulator
MQPALEISGPTVVGPTVIGLATYPPGATFGPRAMKDFEFVWLIEGDAQYRWGDQTALAPEGSMVLCRPGATDFFQWDQRRRTRHGYFHFHIPEIPHDWPAQQHWPLVRETAEGDVLRPLFRHLLTWGNAGDPTVRALTIKLMLTAFVRGQHASGEVPRETLRAPVETSIAFIQSTLDNNPATAIDLDDLAAAAMVSREHLCRLFAAATGRSPIETVRLARLDRVAVLLSRSNYSVKEIAEICGFANPFHLSRAVRRAFGRSPRELRRRIQEGDIPPTSLLVRNWWSLRE